MIAKSGADTSIIEKDFGSFNNITFVKELNKINGFSPGGGLQYGPITQIVPNFTHVQQKSLSGTKEQKLKTLQNDINQGYYITIDVKGGTWTKECPYSNNHFVALDAIQGNHIYIMDPATDEKETWTGTSRWKAACAKRYDTWRKT